MQKQAIHQPKNSNPKLLAHWRFPNEQWREFLYYEKLEAEHRTFLDLRTVVFFGAAVIGLISLGAATKGGLPAFLLVLAGGTLFLSVCYGIHLLIRMSTENTLNSATGDVQITSRNIYVNGGLFFDWGKGWGLPRIAKDALYIGEQKILLLKFSCRGSVTVRGARHETEKHCIVPVELGKESEADAVIKELTETWSQKFPLKSEASK